MSYVDHVSFMKISFPTRFESASKSGKGKKRSKMKMKVGGGKEGGGKGKGWLLFDDNNPRKVSQKGL